MAEFKKRTDIIIYQMGKVASQALQRAFLEHDYKVQHIHWMLDDTGEFPGIRPHIVEKIKNQEQQFKIITTVREPVARNISAFFQQVAKYCQQNNMDYTKATAEELHELFLKVYDIHWPDEWFKREMLPVLNFNAFANNFDHDKGYTIYPDRFHPIMIIRVENINEVLEKAIKEFLDIDNIKMVYYNVGIKKNINKFLNPIYEKFLTLKLPDEFINKNYELQYAKHFYTEDEIKKLKYKWKNLI